MPTSEKVANDSSRSERSCVGGACGAVVRGETYLSRSEQQSRLCSNTNQGAMRFRQKSKHLGCDTFCN